ncbi:hypothetical protein LB505_014222 [Fusarium chuoi]|nr:hypothetical protein LB505_014222 [Fusarium chuoi]
MSSPEKTAEATAASEPQTATANAPSVLDNESAVVDIEKSFAAWVCVFGSFLFLMPTYVCRNVPILPRVESALRLLSWRYWLDPWHVHVCVNASRHSSWLFS